MLRTRCNGRMRSTSGIQDGTHRSYLGSQRGRLVLQFVSRKPFHPAECRAIRSQFRGIRETRFTTLAGGIQNDNRHCQGGRYHPLPDALSQLVDTIGSVTVYWRFVQVSRFVRRRVYGLQEVSQVVSSAAILAAPVAEVVTASPKATGSHGPPHSSGRLTGALRSAERSAASVTSMTSRASSGVTRTGRSPATASMKWMVSAAIGPW